ncbi:MAG: methylmalonyl-CoA mutase family protein [Bacillus sp. (in: firmicutes)]
MNLQKTKDITFPKASMEDWQKKASEALKGKPLEKLYTDTYEGIRLKPVYVNDINTKGRELPGSFPYTRGIHSVPYSHNPWLVAQKIPGASAEEIIRHYRKAQERGQNVMAISFSQMTEMSPEQLTELFRYVALEQQPVHLDTRGGQRAVFCRLKDLPETEKKALHGVIAEDPITEGSLQGKGIKGEFLPSWLKGLAEKAVDFPELKTVLVKSSAFHKAGCTAVQELAIAMSIAVEYLQQAEKAGVDLAELASRMVFAFAIDSEFFMNLAKLRAARKLWATIGHAYGTEEFRMFIHSETSDFTNTLFDQHVNLLRTGNQAFAAILGGTQSLEIFPYDSASLEFNPFSDRVARNIQLILKEETLVDKVVDPAGGSFYVEALTDELVHEAWGLFLDMEEQGGIIASLRTGWLQQQITESAAAKKGDLATGKTSLVGTNVYADLSDEPKSAVTAEIEAALPFEAEIIPPISMVRLAEDYEAFRQASLQFKNKTGTLPQVVLICLGELKSYKPRADFIKSFLAAGGIEGVEKPCRTLLAAVESMQSSAIRHYIFCGQDEEYSEQLLPWLEEWQAIQKESVFYVAGKQRKDTEEQLMNCGIDRFIFSGCNSTEVLKSILKDLEVL